MDSKISVAFQVSAPPLFLYDFENDIFFGKIQAAGSQM